MPVSAPSTPTIPPPSYRRGDRWGGRQWAMVYNLLRRPARQPGQVRAPDRRVAIARLRERYRPIPRGQRVARRLVVLIGVLVWVGMHHQSDGHIAYPVDPAGYDLVLTAFRAECGTEACTVARDPSSFPGSAPSSDLAHALARLGLLSGTHNPRTGDTWLRGDGWTETARHRSPTPTAAQLRVRRRRAETFGDLDALPEGFVAHADGWYVNPSTQ